MFDLIAAQLNHFKEPIGTRVLFDGPPARLKPAAAQGIGMALHEFATNVVKSGTLSSSEGRLKIAQRVAVEGTPAFSTSWLEEGSPNVTAPVQKGFGEIVIGHMAVAAVQDATDITYAENRFSCRLGGMLEAVITE